MPTTVNGIGTAVCGGGGHVKWGGPPDFDAVECFVVLYVPLIPYKAIHTFDWNGNAYRAIPIRWSGALVFRAFLRRWLWLVVVLGVICLCVGLFGDREPPTLRLLLGLIAVATCAGSGLCWWLLAETDRRNRDLRTVLGKHQLGSSDPATWTDDILSDINDPRQAYNADTFEEAAERLLKEGRFSSAMWAARLCAALEDPARGEELTDEILRDPDVQQALAEVRRNPMRWSLEMDRPMR
ncbi:MAG TPA: hypothetical protein VFA26_01885 [Gemmataceae bacterium]|nr:hypothetical protein [Gemmataceae bacterium]